MESSPVAGSVKRLPDSSTGRSEPDGGSTRGKRRAAGRPHGEVLFRILCPSEKTGGVIGKGGAVIRHVRKETGAKIRIDDPISGCDERVIFISGTSDPTTSIGEYGEIALPSSPAQQALLRVFERIVNPEEDRCGDDEKERDSDGLVACRLLAPTSHVGCVLGKGGKTVEKMRSQSGAHIRIFSQEHIPLCAGTGDELIQITGSISSVRKALLAVSSCLQDNLRLETNNYIAAKSSGPPFPHRTHGNGPHFSDYHSRGYSFIPASENSAVAQRKYIEEEVVFRLLCPIDVVGSLIGRGGTIIRGLKNETGALIKILDAVPDSEERVVVISALETSELKYSPAQDAVIRVHSRITEGGADKSSIVSSRLLITTQQIGSLFGKGGKNISEMRRLTGASIRIFVNEHVPKCASPNDNVVQLSGGVQSVHDALLHITSRLREIIIPMQPYSSVLADTQTEVLPIKFKHMHEPISRSPGHYSSSVSKTHGPDHPASFPQAIDRHPALSHSVDHLGPVNADLISHPSRGEILGHTHDFDHSSPRSWPSQVMNKPYPDVADIRVSLGPSGEVIGSGNQASVVANTTIVVVVPQHLVGLVYGENGNNLSQIRQISNAKVTIEDASPGATEGKVSISGNSNQTHAAQSLLHAFIMCGLTAL